MGTLSVTAFRELTIAAAVIASDTFLLGFRLPNAVNPYEILFQEGRGSEGALAGMQTYAAYRLLRSGAVSPQTALTKRLQLIQLINKRMKQPSLALSDDVIQAVLGVIATDMEPGNGVLGATARLEAEVHIKGLAQVVNMRGGSFTLPAFLQRFYAWLVTSYLWSHLPD